LPDLLPDPKSITLGESDPVNGLWPNGKARDKGNGKEKARFGCLFGGAVFLTS